MKVYSPFALTLMKSQRSAAAGMKLSRKWTLLMTHLQKYIEIYLARYEEIINQLLQIFGASF